MTERMEGTQSQEGNTTVFEQELMNFDDAIVALQAELPEDVREGTIQFLADAQAKLNITTMEQFVQFYLLQNLLQLNNSRSAQRAIQALDQRIQLLALTMQLFNKLAKAAEMPQQPMADA